MKSKKWIELFFKFWSFFSWAVLQVRVTPSKINGVCHEPAQKPVPNPNTPCAPPALSTGPGPRSTRPGCALGCSLLFPVPFQMLPITPTCVTMAGWSESCPESLLVQDSEAQSSQCTPPRLKSHFPFPSQISCSCLCGRGGPSLPSSAGVPGICPVPVPLQSWGMVRWEQLLGKAGISSCIFSGFAASHSW